MLLFNSKLTSCLQITAWPPLCCILSAFNAYEQQADLVCTVFILMILYFVQACNTSTSLADQGVTAIFALLEISRNSTGCLSRLLIIPVVIEMMHQVCFIQVS